MINQLFLLRTIYRIRSCDALKSIKQNKIKIEKRKKTYVRSVVRSFAILDVVPSFSREERVAKHNTLTLGFYFYENI